MRAMLIQATKRWPGVVTIHLWPYAIRMANQAYNATPLNAHTDKQSPNKIFDNSAVDINPKHWKPFGCPTYVLKSELQGTTGIHPKWDARSRAGIYLGQSPIHNRNVALVLNIHTGYVSPQFHVKFDESFRTVLQDKWERDLAIKYRFYQSHPTEYPMRRIPKFHQNVVNRQNNNRSQMGRSKITQGRGKW